MPNLCNEYAGRPHHRRIVFGIPSLDELFGGRAGELGIDCSQGPSSPTEASTSICITGPDGTGKSVLALHLAAHFAAACDKTKSQSRTLYFSTDLTFAKAQRIWENFALNRPFDRPIPFGSEWHSQLIATDIDSDQHTIELTQLFPDGASEDKDGLAQEIRNTKRRHVGFVDLATHTSGDDWGFLCRSIAALPEPADNEKSNLVIIDAVEGLETYVGEFDSYGLKRTRRSRVAQVVRAAANKAHICFIVEESDESVRLAEDYVSDVVLRLRTYVYDAGTRQHLRRTLEIEKARGQTHARGQHAYTIRDGRGHATCGKYHASDPNLCWTVSSKGNPTNIRLLRDQVQDPSKAKAHLVNIAYVQVFPSLDYVNSVPAGSAETAETRPYSFGIEYLDDMLPIIGHGSAAGRGVAPGSLTALIGEDGTNRSKVSLAFLRQALVGPTKDIAVLLALRDIEIGTLLKQLGLESLSENERKDVLRRLIVQKLPTRDCTAAILYHIFLRVVDEAVRVRTETGGNSGVRLVLNNFAAMAAQYPELLENPLFLPTITQLLSNRKVATLFVHTDAGGPDRKTQNALTMALCECADHRLFTWHVPFFGEDRVAIAAIPPISTDRSGIIRELSTSGAGEVSVHPRFEMYTGLLERGEVRLVPLQVRLWAPDGSSQGYFQDVEASFEEVFPVQPKPVLTTAHRQDYDSFRAASHLRGHTQMEGTVVVQVDEFWNARHGELVSVKDYVNEKTCLVSGNTAQPVLENDPYLVFQLTKKDEFTKGPRRRVEFFSRMLDAGDAIGSAEAKIDRVPYTWDFGMLLTDSRAWREASDQKVPICYEDPPQKSVNSRYGAYESQHRYKSGFEAKTLSVGALLDKLRDDPKDGISWRSFLRAAAVVARKQAGATPAPGVAFDVDMTAPESLNCLVLEVWASAILETDHPTSERGFHFANRRLPRDGNPCLTEMLEGYMPEFYRAWLILGEVLSRTQFGPDSFTADPRPARKGAVAARHWYSTACLSQRNHDSFLEVLRLPGQFSVRGDWFLGIAGGSRSTRLGERAIDLLSTRRRNAHRLQYGVGLPTRELAGRSGVNHVRSALVREDDGRYTPLTYEELIALGAPASKLNWLFRSAILDYDRQSSIFLKMNLYLLSRCSHYWSKLAAEDEDLGIRSGFHAYDFLRYRHRITHTRTPDRALKGEPVPPTRPSYRDFKDDCSQWIERLQDAALKSQPH